jgi:hypothetical protein
MYLILEAFGWSDWAPDPAPSQEGRHIDQIGDEILPAMSTVMRQR